MNLGPTELIIILIIVIVLFGVGRISKIAGEMGSGIRAFKDGLGGEDDAKKSEKPASAEASAEDKTDKSV
jgi:sec-independent protein translocase protein TatA